MIEARNLVKIYKPKKGVPVIALDKVSLKFPDKGMVFILGKSGSGKSTLLNVLGGLDSFDSGEILIKGKPAESFKQADYDSYRNTYIGFIFQEYNIIDNFTVGANVALAIQLQGRKATDEEINKILKEVDLEGYGNRKPNELSGGQKQRVAIARALVKNPDIIMADEPTGALDSNTGKQVFETLQKLSENKLVLIVSHDREFAERYGDRVIELADGRVIGDDEKFAERIEEKQVENVVYDNNEIHVKKGYHLTKKDLDAINAYLDNLNGDANINNSEFVAKENKKIGANFRPTNQDNIEMSNEGYKLIKSKLPLSTSFKIGASGLNHKKFRLIFTIFLSFVAFTLFGLADTVSSYDFINTAANSLVDSNIDYASFQKYEKEYWYDDDDEEDYYWSSSSGLSLNDIQKIKDETGIYVKGLYLSDKTFSYRSHIDDSSTSKLEEITTVFPSKFNGLISMTQDELVNNFGYSISIGRLPTADNEIAITRYIAEEFTKIGFKAYDDTNKKYSDTANKCSTYTDMCGKQMYLNGTVYTIVGIVDTGFDYTRYNSLNDKVDDDDMAAMILHYALAEELEYAQTYSLNTACFVNEGVVTKISDANGDCIVNAYNFNPIGLYKNTWYYSEDETYEYLEQLGGIAKSSTYIYPISYYDDDNKTIDDNEIVISPRALFNYYEYSYVEEHDNLYVNKSAINDFIVSDTIGEETVTNFDSEEYGEQIELSKFDVNGRQLYVSSEVGWYSGTSNNLSIYLSCGKLAIDYVKAHTDKYSSFDTYQEAVEAVAYDIYNGDLDYELKEAGLTQRIKLYSTIFSQFNELKNITAYEQPNKYSSVFNDKTFKIIGISSDYDETDFVVFSDSYYNEFTDNYEPGIYQCAVGAMPKGKTNLKTLLEYCYDEDKDVRYTITNSVCYELSMIKDILDELKEIFIWVGLFFAVFAALMLSNFISTSVSYKKKDIGILRAIGSRSWDVFQIFFSESFIIAMINFVLSLIGTATITYVINLALREEVGLLVTILTFGFRQVGLLLLICLFVAFIATVLPVFKYARKRPIETIRKANE